MLPRETIEEIDRLLRAGELSQRKIARRLGVSRGTVSSVASGRRGLFGTEQQDDKCRSATPPTRCPRCGYRVYLPCLICRARERHRERQILAAIRPQRRRSPPNGIPGQRA